MDIETILTEFSNLECIKLNGESLTVDIERTKDWLRITLNNLASEHDAKMEAIFTKMYADCPLHSTSDYHNPNGTCVICNAMQTHNIQVETIAQSHGVTITN